MAKTSEACTDQRNVAAPTAPQICAAMEKAICDVKRDAVPRNVKLAVTSKIVVCPQTTEKIRA